MAKLFQPIRFWMARFTCRKSSASSSSSCPSRPSSGLQPATRRWRAFVRRPSGRPASTKHTSATAALRSLAASFTSFGCGSAMSAVCAYACHRPSIHHPPVGHGRGLASRPGCAVPGEGGGSPWLHLASSGVRRYCSAPPASARLRPASPTPGERGRRRNISKFGYKSSMILSHAYRKI